MKKIKSVAKARKAIYYNLQQFAAEHNCPELLQNLVNVKESITRNNLTNCIQKSLKNYI